MRQCSVFFCGQMIGIVTCKSCIRNTDKQGGNILIQIIRGNRKAMGKNKDIRAAGENTGRRPTAGSMEGCVAPEDLARMKDTDIREADVEMLADILEIEIDGNLSDSEKKREFIRQVRNPYLYRQGEYIVKLSFADTDATLTDRLKEYIEHVASAGL